MFKAQTISAILFAAGLHTAFAQGLNPSTMPRIAQVDPRFQSYNIEMVEVIGGRFWKPYASYDKEAPAKSTNNPTGLDPNLYEQRRPIDLSNPKLRRLASALGPVYLRVSGTWANTVYFQDSDAPAPPQPPKGFGGTLTRSQWKGVIDFVHATGSKLVTSFSVSEGTRDSAEVWTPTQAKLFIDATHRLGGSIAATEFINEPTFTIAAGTPPGYDGVAFGRDYAIFRAFLRQASPQTKLLGPGSVGEGIPFVPVKIVPSTDLLQGMGPNSVDAFSYHFYGTISERCAKAMGPNQGTTPAAALTEEWLDRTTRVEEFYASLRDKYEPGKPMWLTETGQTACGGDRWASTFLDSFRYLDQLGRLAQKNVQVVMHNTLAASDYGLIDEATLAPRPNYWAALLWHRTMGATVLDPGPSPSATVHLYAQCAPGKPGAVTLLAINLNRTEAAAIELPQAADRYTLTAGELESRDVLLNGKELSLTARDELLSITGEATKAGLQPLPAASITFFELAGAKNAACMK
ncbi:Glycosyl hydrolase family 79, N-terminal domain [Bryocella elongata]|uniref:Glycosyl hydrolase family 79, N-terminal domain n=1 Tax=Bryocella elongata TaxID=863522 RepID=A0A1H6B4J9_9BACT|nr:hypothetical protein [Bryocella elongata]SEG55474.1 Glycosyl hydrolase family 79, N-terminal domain [Bryocella elongata]